MKNIAILGFGTVGRGCADLLTDNKAEVTKLGGEEIRVKRILDLRDFPDTPYADRITHDFKEIENDPEIDTVIEAMGGSHPAFEFSAACLKKGKNVITSNKELVANFGEELMNLAKENNCVYRFEASVGGGIPVLTPIISFLGQNKITEVRGILNGTTNFILTQMFTYGTSFASALADAQERGFAEANPDADILGLDACRKLVILAGLITGKLFPVEKIHTEGITGIRSQDVQTADRLGCNIKLLGRCLVGEDGRAMLVVAPFLLPRDLPLSGTLGVFNAVEVVGEPIGNVMFYGKGAGAGATASAVIGDLMLVMRSGRNAAFPEFKKTEEGLCDFGEFEAQNYIVLPQDCREKVSEAFEGVSFLAVEENECAFLTKKMKESEVDAALEAIGVKPLSRIRMLK